MKPLCIALAMALSAGVMLRAAETGAELMTVTNEKGAVQILAPTFKDVAYGKHPKQVLHLWQARSDKPAPLLVFIHGGSWTGGSRTDQRFCALLPDLLKAGIAVASVEYRFLQEAAAEQVAPPVKGCLHDAARAVQFLRSQAGTWKIDKTRVALAGGSAGACSSLWLAFHDDLADPQSAEPVARESTRVLGAAVAIAQTTLDPRQMREWTPNSIYGAHAFGLTGKRNREGFDAFLAQRERLLPWIAEFSPYALVTKDDPPVYLWYGSPPALGQDAKDPTHTANFGVKLQEHCKAIGVACELNYPGAPGVKHADVPAYLIDLLKAGPRP
jgi:acetyl esterase/lipase